MFPFYQFLRLNMKTPAFQLTMMVVSGLLFLSCSGLKQTATSPEFSLPDSTVDETKANVAHTPDVKQLSPNSYAPDESTKNGDIDDATDGNASAQSTIESSLPQSSQSEHPIIEFGYGGLIKDLSAWSKIGLPQFVIASHIDVEQIEFISKFRSSAGHDFSDSFESCCSMKHYYRPLDYYDSRFTQPIYSPVDGVLLYISDRSYGSSSNEWEIAFEEASGKTVPADYLDLDLYIRPDNAPNVWVRHMHVNPIYEILDVVSITSPIDLMMGTARPSEIGFRVTAGDLIGHGLGEISITKHHDGTGIPTPCNSKRTRSEWANSPGCKEVISHHSVFELMSDEVFEEYEKNSQVDRADFIIPVEERKANFLECDGEDFLNPGSTGDPEVFVRLQ